MRDRLRRMAIFFACYVVAYLVGFALMLIVQALLR